MCFFVNLVNCKINAHEVFVTEHFQILKISLQIPENLDLYFSKGLFAWAYIRMGLYSVRRDGAL